ncbi:HAD family hydrolase [Corynebacterium anserum]|uniref:HAD-IA family hydrolase n=1 Tax=Corynebacterium anserum TaxID=2684406 RepID=A0A7G7YPN4_9CORY|nr:HAD-IA family hydrolase [Corynebacterium anserum]MBC2682092.1 HAD-IA family hydrolase [Corynebacterium anserum]QNH96454.1 HAD-IA family hydrolase [Corynebacterium anserum]
MRGLVVDYCGVLDGAEEDRRRWRKLLAAAKEEGLATAILSNDPGGSGADHIRVWKEQGLVDDVILSGEVGAEKPSEEIFTIVADRLELPVNDLVLVDDSILNIRGAVEAGMIGIFYQQFDRAIVEITGVLEMDGDF